MIYGRVLNASNGRQHLHNYLIPSRIAYTQRWPHGFCMSCRRLGLSARVGFWQVVLRLDWTGLQA